MQEYPCPYVPMLYVCVFFSSRRRHTRLQGDWSSDVCSSDLSTSTVTAGFGSYIEVLAEVIRREWAELELISQSSCPQEALVEHAISLARKDVALLRLPSFVHASMAPFLIEGRRSNVDPVPLYLLAS